MSGGAKPVSGGAHILVVDDEPTICELICTKLHGEGYQTCECASGQAGWDQLVQENFDLAIFDLNIPDIDGYSLIERVRTDLRLKNLPIMILTGSSGAYDVEKAYTLGATSFVTKPVNWSMFGYQVRNILRAAEREKALSDARHEAIHATRHKDNIIKVLAHELRTPLHHIIGFSELLQSRGGEASDQELRDYLGDIADAGHKLLSTLTEIMLYSRILSNDVELHEEEYSAVEILKRVVAARQKEADARNIDIRLRIMDPPCNVICDYQMLIRVLINLLDNAIKFSREGASVQIGMELMQDGSLACFINDHGVGMDTETLDMCLSPFLQVEGILARETEGCRIGLPISKAIIGLHGGEIHISSVFGKGTKGTILLPKERIMPRKNQRSRAFFASA